MHVSVVDDATGRPVPCRVHFRSPAGIPYQPHGHHNHVAQNLGSWHYDVGGDVRLGQRSYAYIDGTCQGWLPRGDVVVDVARGFEYEPLRQTVRIEPGQRELTLRIGRVADLASEGWWSGDSHVHFLSTPGAQLEQRGEDLRVVNLLQAQWGALFTNTEDFSGRPGVVDGGGYVTYVGQENRQHMLGHSLLWGLKEPVMPWSSDGPDEAELGGALDATLSDWADRTHAQGGTVVAAHFPNPNGEPAVLVATGRADAVEMLAQSDDAMLEYYRYLNCGYRLPLVGGTDKMSSEVPVGLYRTYAKLDEEFSYEAWCRAVRSGRTFLSGGPLLTLSVDGREPGDTVALSGPGTVSVQAAVRSVFPLRSLEIVRNGEVVARAEADGGRQAEINARNCGSTGTRGSPAGPSASITTSTSGAAGSSRTPRRSTSPAAATGRWPTPRASAISERWSTGPATTCGTPRCAGPTSSRPTTTARPTTSRGWSGRSTRPCARSTSAAARRRVRDRSRR